MPDDEITIDTSEMDGLAEMLDNFSKELQQKIISDSMKQGALLLQGAVMQKCPVRLDEPTAKSTGAKPAWLKADIHIEKLRKVIGYRIGAGPTMAYLLRWLEFGHQLVKGGQVPWTDGKRRRGGKGHVIGHVPAHPVLRPAFDEHIQAAIKVTADEMRKQIAEYWKRAQKVVKKVA